MFRYFLFYIFVYGAMCFPCLPEEEKTHCCKNPKYNIFCCQKLKIRFFCHNVAKYIYTIWIATLIPIPTCFANKTVEYSDLIENTLVECPDGLFFKSRLPFQKLDFFVCTIRSCFEISPASSDKLVNSSNSSSSIFENQRIRQKYCSLWKEDIVFKFTLTSFASRISTKSLSLTWENHFMDFLSKNHSPCRWRCHRPCQESLWKLSLLDEQMLVSLQTSSWLVWIRC